MIVRRIEAGEAAAVVFFQRHSLGARVRQHIGPAARLPVRRMCVIAIVGAVAAVLVRQGLTLARLLRGGQLGIEGDGWLKTDTRHSSCASTGACI